MRKHEPIDGPSGQQTPEGHYWVAMFMLVPEDDEEYAFEDVQFLSYVPAAELPPVAFDGLAEQERNTLQKETGALPRVARISLSLYDEESKTAMAIKDALNREADPFWCFSESFDSHPGGGLLFDDAVEAFRATLEGQPGPRGDPRFEDYFGN